MDTQLSWDGRLESWDNVWKSCKQYQEEQGGKIGLLLGNGASCAVWKGFEYRSLYETAKSGDFTPSLTEQDTFIFDQMGTKDFEQALYDLWKARMVCDILEQPSRIISEHYDYIKDCLIATVHRIHVRYSSQLEQRLKKIQEALMDYEAIYTTNYDLLLYWAIMWDERKFRDFFWSHPDNLFDSTNTALFSPGMKPVFYLHGGLHLVRLPTGQAKKIKAQLGGSLLDQFYEAWTDGKTPLFISEGTDEEKRKAINSSSYLSFVNHQFAAHNGPLIILGHALKPNDQHLIDAIKERERWGEQRFIAISIRQQGKQKEEIIDRARRYQKLFPKARFFAAETHPLGDPDLLIPENGD